MSRNSRLQARLDTTKSKAMEIDMIASGEFRVLTIHVSSQDKYQLTKSVFPKGYIMKNYSDSVHRHATISDFCPRTKGRGGGR